MTAILCLVLLRLCVRGLSLPNHVVANTALEAE
jgi:hypothetical protein